MRKGIGFLLGAAALLGFGFSSLAAPAAPQLSGPIAAPDIPGSGSHNYIFFASNHNLAANGYVEEEYFVRGAASTYDTPAGKTGAVKQTGLAYMTRIVVRRPLDPRRFNGAAIVEWDNVSNYFDAENVWFYDWQDMMRSGYVWVGVSPQTVGIAALRKWNARRYGQLNVGKSDSITPADPRAPDRDAESYDIFTQVGQLLKHPGSVDPLGGLRPKVFLATGESQSAGRLATYVNSVHPLARVYDGFLLLSAGTRLRDDLISPVFKLMAEHDIITGGGAASRQPDTDKYREWEITGASHVDAHLRESREPLELRDNLTSTEAVLAPQCPYPQLGTRVHTDYAVAAAFSHLAKWAAGGRPPPKAPQIQITKVNAAPADSEVARDRDTIALGGVREPPVMVPIAVNIGVGKLGSSRSAARGESIGPAGCIRWGYSADFSAAELATRYPSHAGYVARVKSATGELLRKGFILPADAAAAVREALDSHIGGP